MNRLTDRVALVTGGSRGIGRAVAMAQGQAGATVAVNYRERAADANAVLEEIQGQGGRAEAFRCDVSVGASVQQLIRAVTERFGRIDVLVNNAGITASHGPVTTEEDFATARSRST